MGGPGTTGKKRGPGQEFEGQAAKGLGGAHGPLRWELARGHPALPRASPFSAFRSQGHHATSIFLKAFFSFFIKKKKNPIIAQISQQGSVWNKNSQS